MANTYKSFKEAFANYEHDRLKELVKNATPNEDGVTIIYDAPVHAHLEKKEKSKRKQNIGSAQNPEKPFMIWNDCKLHSRRYEKNDAGRVTGCFFLVDANPGCCPKCKGVLEKHKYPVRIDNSNVADIKGLLCPKCSQFYVGLSEKMLKQVMHFIGKPKNSGQYLKDPTVLNKYKKVKKKASSQVVSTFDSSYPKKASETQNNEGKKSTINYASYPSYDVNPELYGKHRKTLFPSPDNHVSDERVESK